MKKVFLKKDREKLWLSGHPWIYSGAVDKIEQNIIPGSIVEVFNHKNEFIGYGHYNKNSKIIVRMLEHDKTVSIDANWYNQKIKQAYELRMGLNIDSNAFRLIHSESDFLPGLIIDYFNGYVILQISTLGMERDKEFIIQALINNIPNLKGIYEKSEGDGRKLEGLPEKTQILWGEIPDTIEIFEGNANFIIDLKGQKTGFYSDQRENRILLGNLSKGKNFLDVCSYTGGFSVHAMSNGANSATLIDISEDALNVAKENLKKHINVEFIKGNIFDILRVLIKEGRKWDVVSLDPPKLAPNKRDLEKALKAYKDIILNGIKLTNNGGLLAIYSCSGAVSSSDLRMALAYAVKDAGVKATIVHQLHQSSCHPISVSVPETEYLKGFLVRVIY
ncbi:class I SAM-dependent rRNA methyltransferase [Fusobacterium mortiferum]|uniref:Class I SAM-dependent rRNA methyltransferase n=1 Tax=Fusobacterium mortiferum TaxID=850 RepID=A0ABS2G651_FUSMR|nr:class I SAM-dependent rRNA methyltransferase [Fusobacterium mortiferum]MBM6691306.1 class I SAM-dependent rRNA methyltransferase [Fusobacterium mortiferum]MBM6876184.1 class I SAM-dependent rRNA methyltransferase [Fusobacterium mortiferum]